MASKNESVIVYQSWLENAAKLGPEKQAKAIMQIVKYGIYGETPDNSDDLCLDLLLSDWMPLVDAQQKKRKGGAPKGNKNAVGNKGGTGRPKKDNLKTQPFNVNGNGNGNSNANYNYHHPSADIPAIEGAGNTASGSVDGDDDEWWKTDDAAV